ncbi:MAG TPA: hypothetical protein VE291_11475 [Terracidiphilus sp.]|jgi:hypothetical protein|nr:hypothetical protein [Terracidiphilus sp.]
MSLLQQSPAELDDAARGESLTKGTSHIVIAAIVAAVVVSAAIAIYVIAGQKPPVATGEVLDVWARPTHVVTPGFDANGAAMSQSTYDQVLVFTRVRLHNQSKAPLFLHEILTNITLPDGTIDSSTATTASQYDRFFLAYPQFAQWHAPALKTDELTLEAGQTVEGTFVTSFKMAKDTWDARKALDYTVNFRYQPLVKLTPPVSVQVSVTDR